MARGRKNIPDEPVRSSRRTRKSLANENRLMALGDAVDKKSGVRRKTRRRRSTGKKISIAAIALVVALGGVVGGGYLYARYKFGLIPKITVANEVKPISGKPFNILMIGSDSRAGLTGAVAAQTGASTGSVSGQRSDVVKIIHVDPTARTIAMLSIPRDTMVTLLANQSLYGNFNRINVNFGNGPSLLAQTITANFGIQITYTIVVSFAGMINAADAIGGVYLDFPYPSRDPYSGLNIMHGGCQIVKGFEALATTRSRHFYYNIKGSDVWNNDYQYLSYNELAAKGWYYDGTSDFGRIDRQNAFLRGMVTQLKKLYNPIRLNDFVSNLPQGVTLDSAFSFNELIGLAERFHSLNANAIRTYTLPVTSGTTPDLGDVLFVQQPEAQEVFLSVFGKNLIEPTNPPPNAQLQTPLPPVVTTTTSTTTTTLKATTKGHKKHSTSTSSTTTTTTNPTLAVPAFDPVPCTP